jgi:uroporphyrinogen-III synthase
MGEPLTNFTVLVTRPEQGGQDLCAVIAEHGGNAVHFPTIGFAPPNQPDDMDKVTDYLASYDLLIFISPQAVLASQDSLIKKWSTLERKPKIAAVGEGTKKILLNSGCAVDYVPLSTWGSEGLLALPALQAVEGQHILIIRGEGGREILADTLRERGAQVSQLPAYQRIVPRAISEQVLLLMKKKQIHAIVCTSFTGVQNLKTMLQQKGWGILQPIPLVVVSDRIRLLAQALGFGEIHLAENVSHDSILQTLIQLRNESCQKK